MEDDKGRCPELFSVAECIDALAVLRVGVLRLGLLLTVVRGKPGRDICSFVGFDNVIDGREVEEPERGRRVRKATVWAGGRMSVEARRYLWRTI